MSLTGEEIRMIIAARKEAEALVRAEANVGILREPPPLLRGLDALTHISEIKPRELTPKQKERNRKDAISGLERALRNPNLRADVRETYRKQLAELKIV